MPDSAARIGVPVGTAMSMPGWQFSQARDSQNGEVSGPLTGQIIPLEPALIGPAVDGPENPASLAWIFACWACSCSTSSCSSWRRSRELASSANLFERAVRMRSRRSTSPTRIVETSSRSDSICLATRASRFSSLSRRLDVAAASALASATMFMIFASWRDTRSMNSVRVSRSAKPSDSSTTVIASGASAL